MDITSRMDRVAAQAEAPLDGPALAATATPAAVRIWLLVVAALVFAMIVVGGATRLTGSGLSITEWQPIVGTIPPLNEEQWEEAFAKYREIPQYQIINRGMSLHEFKSIFWWEWGHRFLGRFIGVAFLVPFAWFLWRGAISRPLLPRLLFLFALGGFQGALGWYMVMSGLVDRTEVSQYRLAAHLAVAVAIFGYALWLALDRGYGAPATRTRGTGLSASAAALVGLVFVQIVAGALVAGLNAGQGYNTWPLMMGHLVPPGLLAMEPAWVNVFENALAVQFTHRMIAYLVVAFALGHAAFALVRDHAAQVRTTAVVVATASLAQAGLGIWTLLVQVPIDLALFHQAGAVILIGLALVHLHATLQPQAAVSG